MQACSAFHSVRCLKTVNGMVSLVVCALPTLYFYLIFAYFVALVFVLGSSVASVNLVAGVYYLWK